MTEKPTPSSDIEEILARKGFVLRTAKGASMLPFIRPGRDCLLLTPPEPPPRRGDVVLYRDAGRLVLHRVVGRQAGELFIRGDNDGRTARVPATDVIAVLRRMWRDGREIHLRGRGYRLGVRLWTLTRPTNAVLRALLRLARKSRSKLRKKSL